MILDKLKRNLRDTGSDFLSLSLLLLVAWATHSLEEDCEPRQWTQHLMSDLWDAVGRFWFTKSETTTKTLTFPKSYCHVLFPFIFACNIYWW